MRELTYFVAVTADGFACGPDGSYDFFPTAEDTGAFHAREYPELIPTHIRGALGIEGADNRHFDTLLQGRGSYDLALKEGVTSPFAHMRQYVASTTITESPDPDVHIISADPVEAVRALKREDGDLGICVVGGPTLAGALYPEIDAVFLKRYPVMAGAGKPVFAGAEFSPAEFAPVEHHRFDSGADYTLFRRR
ncbi:dihydrofolate reductase family protein [Nocardiopsis sp. RSe5-2]|uniref:Dihydrofolate reductase family protein n=1 Tax=Nocardiopsis endophytica TaxID=3018445 RepID=A0ABT4TYB2_9ACTN|nr:dihydrofolate reductase family protein [Nocardiopsis endophytica]MDA2809688.1 dihydrofolate reductase family protein [Nocardiopsis endophytica]